MCNRWLTEKMPNFLDNSSHFVLFVLVEIEDVAEFLTFGRNNFERWLLDNFSHFVLFVLVEIEDVADSSLDKRNIVARSWKFQPFCSFRLGWNWRRRICSFRLACNWSLCRMLDLQTEYRRVFLIISAIMVYSSCLKLKTL